VWRRKKERTSRCALDEKDGKDYFIFIEGACDRFLLSDFPVFGKKTDLHGWRADGRACSHNLRSVHGNK
jgi:hypothetical protein